MFCSRLHAWWSTQSRLATLLSSLGPTSGRRFGTSKMHLSPPMAYAAVCSKAVVLLLLTFCLLLIPLWESAIVLCFVVRYFLSILVL